MTMTEDRQGLPPFEDMAVVGSTIKVTKAGDGLSDALSVDPVALHLDDEVVLVLRGVVRQVNHRPEKPSDPDSDLVRQHTIETVGVTMVKGDARDNLTKLLDDDAARVKEELARRKGAHTLDDGQGEICPVCGDVFDTSAELEQHAEDEHDEDDGE